MPQGNANNIQELIEQHIEKGLLGLCAVLLILAVGRWVLSSPRAINLYTGDTTRQVAPGDVDKTLLEAARTVQMRANRQQFDAPKKPDFLWEIGKRRDDPFVVSTEAFVALWYPPALRERITGASGEKFTIEELQQDIMSLFADGEEMAAPTAWARRVLFRQGQGEQAEAQDMIIAHVVGKFPLRELRAKWEKKLERAGTSIRAVVAGVEVQSESRMVGGQWAKNAVQLASPPVTIGGAEAPPQVPEYNGTNRSEIWQSVQSLNENWQKYLLRPDYWQVFDSTDSKWVDWSADMPGDVDLADPDALWFHDSSLKPMQEYRYCYRLKLVNPLLGAADDVDPNYPDQASQRFIYTRWSPWSAPVGVKGTMEFFVLGFSRNENSVNVAVFALVKGQRVRADFTIKPGEPIGGRKDVAVIDPISQNKTIETVDFFTGSVLVWIDFDKDVYQGVNPAKDTEVLYLDDQGYLRTRLVKQDKTVLEELSK